MPPQQDANNQQTNNWQTPQPSAPPTPPTPAQNSWQTPVASASPQITPTPSPQPASDAHSVLNPKGSPDDDMYKAKFSRLNLSPGEKVLREMKRHPIGVLQIYVTSTLVMLALLFAAGALIRFSHTKDVVDGGSVAIPVGAILGIAGVLALLVVVIAAVAVRVYHGNRLYLTNESVIQRIQNSLLDVKEQQVPLGRIEDVSYEQRGMMQHMFNYGTIRLSTEGEETTYYFHYAMEPRDEAANIITAQEEYEKIHGPHRY